MSDMILPVFMIPFFVFLFVLSVGIALFTVVGIGFIAIPLLTKFKKWLESKGWEM